jgi:HSP20 family molecular chaperone IbpA
VSTCARNKTHTEFGYGTYDRTVPMSTGIEDDSIRASYQDGIPEINAKVSADGAWHRAIPITAGAATGKGAKH